MTKKKKLILIGSAAVVLAVLVLLNIRSSRGKATEVQVTAVARKDISKVITASGEIQPKRRVNVSARSMGKVTRLAVREGERVKAGQFLLEIDPEPYESAVDQLQAAVRGAQASLEMEKTSLAKARDDHERAVKLHEGGYMSDTEFKSALSTYEVAEARARAANENLVQSEANLRRAHHDLKEVRITAEMSGIITALNVEEGESAIVGTMNNPGTVLLTIADLSEIEAEVRVDETEVVVVKVGQPARVRLDAQPDTTFRGVVTEVGNSAIRSAAGMGQESVDFKVVIAITDSLPNLRPGLSASVDITVAEEKQVLAVPIQSLTVRDPARLASAKSQRRGKDETAADTAVVDTTKAEGAPRDIEGVFVVKDGVANFRPVRVGIAGQSHFVVLSGLAQGDDVVSGPFKVISDLDDGERVKVRAEKKARKNP